MPWTFMDMNELVEIQVLLIDSKSKQNSNIATGSKNEIATSVLIRLRLNHWKKRLVVLKEESEEAIHDSVSRIDDGPIAQVGLDKTIEAGREGVVRLEGSGLRGAFRRIR